jgi:hypothetical protein
MQGEGQTMKNKDIQYWYSKIVQQAYHYGA